MFRAPKILAFLFLGLQFGSFFLPGWGNSVVYCVVVVIFLLFDEVLVRRRIRAASVQNIVDLSKAIVKETGKYHI